MFWLNKQKGKERYAFSEKLWQSFAGKKRRQYEKPLRAESQSCRDVASIPPAGDKPLQTQVTVSCEGSRDLIPQHNSVCKAEKGLIAIMDWNIHRY